VALGLSAAEGPVVDPAAVRHFFNITRTVYDGFAFVHEARDASRTCLEWEGRFQGNPVSGATILSYSDSGLIREIQLYTGRTGRSSPSPPSSPNASRHRDERHASRAANGRPLLWGWTCRTARRARAGMATPDPAWWPGPADYEHHVMPGQPAAGNHVSHADDRRLCRRGNVRQQA